MKINGLHHISMKCYKDDYEKLVYFYTKILGLKIIKKWGNEEIPDGIMIDLINTKLEIFTNKVDDCDTGIIRHLALAVNDVDSLVEKIKENGYTVFIEPKDIIIPSIPETKARIAFCYGPLNEQIELFSEQ